jgi:hypothetical protein
MRHPFSAGPGASIPNRCVSSVDWRQLLRKRKSKTIGACALQTPSPRGESRGPEKPSTSIQGSQQSQLRHNRDAAEGAYFADHVAPPSRVVQMSPFRVAIHPWRRSEKAMRTMSSESAALFEIGTTAIHVCPASLE